jgi:hypothetical protein
VCDGLGFGWHTSFKSRRDIDDKVCEANVRAGADVTCSMSLTGEIVTGLCVGVVTGGIVS